LTPPRSFNKKNDLRGKTKAKTIQNKRGGPDQFKIWKGAFNGGGSNVVERRGAGRA